MPALTGTTSCHHEESHRIAKRQTRLRRGGRGGTCPARCFVYHPRGGIRHYHGHFRIWEIHSSQPAWLPRYAHLRRIPTRRSTRTAYEASRTCRTAQPEDWFRFSELQSAAQDYGGRKCRVATHVQQRRAGQGTRRPRHPRLAARRARIAPLSQVEPDVGRTDAARSHRPCFGERPRGYPGR